MFCSVKGYLWKLGTLVTCENGNSENFASDPTWTTTGKSRTGTWHPTYVTSSLTWKSLTRPKGSQSTRWMPGMATNAFFMSAFLLVCNKGALDQSEKKHTIIVVSFKFRKGMKWGWCLASQKAHLWTRLVICLKEMWKIVPYAELLSGFWTK